MRKGQQEIKGPWRGEELMKKKTAHLGLRATQYLSNYIIPFLYFKRLQNYLPTS